MITRRIERRSSGQSGRAYWRATHFRGFTNHGCFLSYLSTNGIFVFNIKIMTVIGFYTNFHCNNAKNMINLIARKLCKFIRLAVL